MSSGISDSRKQGFDGSGFKDEESTRRRHAPGFFFSFFWILCWFFLLPKTGGQVGVLAAAGLFALDHQVDFMYFDH